LNLDPAIGNRFSKLSISSWNSKRSTLRVFHSGHATVPRPKGPNMAISVEEWKVSLIGKGERT